jgi:outer membrane protein assembly factor BamB
VTEGVAERLPEGVDWQLQMPEGESLDFGGMAYANGTVYRLLATTRFVGVEAVDAANGTVEWQIAKEWSGKGIVADDTGVYFVSRPTQLVAIDPATGADRWAADFAAPVVSSALDDGVLYVWDVSNTLTALDATTGEETWQTAVPSSADTTMPEAIPAVGEDVVVMVDAGGTVHAFDRASGEVAWSVPGFDGAHTRLTIELDRLFVLSGGEPSGDGAPNLTGTGIDLATGDVMWEIGVTGTLLQPVGSEDTFFYVIGDSITPAAGSTSTPYADYSECCAYWAGSPDSEEPAYGGSHVFGIDTETGEEIWSRSTKAGGFVALVTTFPGSGALFAVTSDGHVIQLQRETGGILPDPIQVGGTVHSVISGGATEAGYFVTLLDGTLRAFGAVPASEQG